MSGALTYSLAEIRDGTGWPPGIRFQVAEPGCVPAFLSAADIAAHFGVPAATVQTWRSRYGPDRPAAEIVKAPVCPQPDAVLGLRKPQAGWQAGRLAEWEAWRASLPGRGAGGGRPRTN